MKTATMILAHQRLAEREVVHLARLHRAYLDAIEPFIAMRARIFGMMMPRLTIYQDGRVESVYTATADQQAMLELIQEQINAIQRSFTPAAPGALQP